MESQYEDFLTTLHRFKRESCKLQLSGLPHGEFVTLGTISHLCHKKQEAGEKLVGVKVSELAAKLRTSNPDVSKKVKILEEKGLIERIHDVRDKRVTMLVLSDKGETEFENRKKEMEEFMTGVFDKMGKEDSDEFLRLLKKMVQAMIDEMEQEKI